MLMTVYVVMNTTVESFSTYSEDGYYDDYYDTEVESDELIGIYLSMTNAIKAAEKAEEEDGSYHCRVCWFPYEITDEPDSDEEIYEHTEHTQNLDNVYSEMEFNDAFAWSCNDESEK